MSTKEAIRAYLQFLKEKNCTKATREADLQRLLMFERFLEIEDLWDLRAIEPKHIVACRRAMHQGHPPFRKPLALSTIATYGTTLRGFFQFLEDEEVIFKDPSEHVWFPPAPKVAKPVLSEAEMKRILHLPNLSMPTGIRDRAILEIFYSSGLRLRELLALNLGDLDLEEGILWIRKGKGQKDRVVPIGKAAIWWISKYLEEARPKLLRGEASEAVFLCYCEGKRLGAAGLHSILYGYARESGIRKPISAHTFRRTCASHMLAGGADAPYVQELLGHRSLSTTQLYLQWNLEQLKEAHRKFHPRERKKI